MSVKDLNDEEKRLAELQLRNSEERNRQLDEWCDRLRAATESLCAVANAGRKLWVSYDGAAQHARAAKAFADGAIVVAEAAKQLHKKDGE